VNSILLPWPHAALSPNARAHWRTKHGAARKSRYTASVIGSGRKRLQNPVCAIVPLVATNRRRDIDNVLAGLKSALDGLTDAGWWTDDSMIASFHLVPPVYSKKWKINQVLLAACEAEHERDLAERVKRFREDCATGLPFQALGQYFGIT
jgi:Holliday junction resolvase RusA-like endonuclease